MREGSPQSFIPARTTPLNGWISSSAVPRWRGPPGRGVNLTGYTEKMLLGQWRRAIASFNTEQGHAPPLTAGGASAAGSEQGSGTGFFGSANVNIDLETGQLDFLNQSFTDSSLQASRSKGNWRVAIQGKTWREKFICRWTRPRKTGLRSILINWSSTKPATIRPPARRTRKPCLPSGLK